MAATGYTPISLYYSTTGAAVPLAANLVPGELALNINDMKLYCENSAGVVTLLASAAGSTGDVVGPASATDNAVVRFDGTTGKLVQNSAVTIADTTGDIAGAGSITSTSASGILTRAAATQDGVELVGRAGGTSSYKVTFTPTTLTASRTVTLPDNNINFTTGLTVANGGTGLTSATAYAVLCGGTTSTGAFQSIASVGTSGQVLTSNGAGALPTFQTPSSGGAVGSTLYLNNVYGGF